MTTILFYVVLERCSHEHADCGRYGHAAATCWDTHPDLRPRTRPEQRDRRPLQSAALAERTDCGRYGHAATTCWDTHPDLRPRIRPLQSAVLTERIDPPAELPLSQRIEFPTGKTPLPPPDVDPHLLWDAADYGMVMIIQDPSPPLVTRSTPIGVSNNCFALSMPPPVSTSISQTASAPSPGSIVSSQNPGQWLIDSGASNHYTASRHILTDFHLIPDIQIMTGKGLIAAKGMGNVTLHTSVGLRTIFDVMWVPDLTGKHNLLSIPQLIAKRCTIQMTLDGVTIRGPTGVLLIEGAFSGKGFLVQMAACSTSSQCARLDAQLRPIPLSLPGRSSIYPDSVALLAGTEDTQPLEVWHMRLGHLNQASIQQLTTKATGLVIGPSRPQTVSMKCDSCLRGAQHKQLSYSRSAHTHAIGLLEHIWADLKGPLLDVDIYGFRFFIIFVDEVTRL